MQFILGTQRVLGDRDEEDLVFEAVRDEGARTMLLMMVVMTGAFVRRGRGGGRVLRQRRDAGGGHHHRHRHSQHPGGGGHHGRAEAPGRAVWKCAAWSVFSSLPQPLMAVPAFLFVNAFAPALPSGLGFASGAMIFMVLVELLPEAFTHGRQSGVATIASIAAMGMVLFQYWL